MPDLVAYFLPVEPHNAADAKRVNDCIQRLSISNVEAAESKGQSKGMAIALATGCTPANVQNPSPPSMVSDVRS